MERIIDVTAARRQFGTLLDEVFHKKDIITIQRKGKSLAKIIPLESENHKDNNIVAITPSQKSLFEEMSGLPVIQTTSDPTNILRSMREEKRMKANAKYGK
jgi:antitoxin (DNA-binding transcriptional repressor) of toxin-antitoxin stability system